MKKINYIFYFAVLAFFSVFFAKAETIKDTDMFWHIALGKYMIAHQTLLHTAIYTFAGKNLPYIPHEIGFQLIAAGVYNLFSWNGIYLLNIVCAIFLFIGFVQVVEISKKELGIEYEKNKYNLIVMLIITGLVCIIYRLYFQSRPQIISIPIIVWFFVYLRRFQESRKIKEMVKLSLLSLLLANVHAGTWVVIFVFTGIVLVESIWNKTLTKKHFILFVLISLMGLLNTGGYHTLLYFQTLSNEKSMLNEWNPINFENFKVAFAVLVLFIWLASFSIHKNIFRSIFALGILYLGIQNYKLFLFFPLFMPYYLYPLVNKLEGKKSNFQSTKKFASHSVLLMILLTATYNLFLKAEEPVKTYPVEEMNYILSQTKEGMRPNVLANYNVSGYIIYRGGNSLSDGRFDPFITEESKTGKEHWDAFYRSIHTLYNNDIFETIGIYKPDYVILENGQASKEEEKRLGKPAFAGSFGEVWKLSKGGGFTSN